MEREIKFRGFNEIRNQWIYGYYFKYPNGRTVIYQTDSSCWGVIPSTIGQYTGMKDKNGKEIYEGDVVKGVSHKIDSCISSLIPFDVIGVVGYCKEYQTLEVRTEQVSFHIEVAIKGEIIGNIQDNPEMTIES